MSRARLRGAVIAMGALLGLLYVFLYAPIFYVIYTSFAADIVWPFPPAFSASSYVDLFDSSLYGEALRNSLVLGLGSALLSTVLATGGAIGVLRYRSRWRGPAHAAVPGAAVRGRPPDRHLAAGLQRARSRPARKHVFGHRRQRGSRHRLRLPHHPVPAGALRLGHGRRRHGVRRRGPCAASWKITLPIIWPCLLGAFLISFILAFNNLEISFYNLGAIPTLPSVAWGLAAVRPRPGALRAGGAGQRCIVFAIFARHVRPDALPHRPSSGYRG